jgi:Aminoacyl-tRNA editing domain
MCGGRAETLVRLGLRQRVAVPPLTGGSATIGIGAEPASVALSTCIGKLIWAHDSRTSVRQQTTSRGTMAATPAELFALFDRICIEHSTIEHLAFFTVEEARPWHDKIPGVHWKNLFIKDRKGGIWLVVMPADKRADLDRLEKALGAPRLSFGRPGRCCTDRRVGRDGPIPISTQAIRKESGRPDSNMRFMTCTATVTSVARRSSFRKRSASPITCLYRPMVASTRLRLL